MVLKSRERFRRIADFCVEKLSVRRLPLTENYNFAENFHHCMQQRNMKYRHLDEFVAVGFIE